VPGAGTCGAKISKITQRSFDRLQHGVTVVRRYVALNKKVPFGLASCACNEKIDVIAEGSRGRETVAATHTQTEWSKNITCL
jgi:hypothetical protein